MIGGSLIASVTVMELVNITVVTLDGCSTRFHAGHSSIIRVLLSRGGRLRENYRESLITSDIVMEMVNITVITLDGCSTRFHSGHSTIIRVLLSRGGRLRENDRGKLDYIWYSHGAS